MQKEQNRGPHWSVVPHKEEQAIVKHTFSVSQ
jgi:hypothetical protein